MVSIILGNIMLTTAGTTLVEGESMVDISWETDLELA